MYNLLPQSNSLTGHRAELLRPKWRCESKGHARWVAAAAAKPGGRGDDRHTVFYLGHSWQVPPSTYCKSLWERNTRGHGPTCGAC